MRVELVGGLWCRESFLKMVLTTWAVVLTQSAVMAGRAAVDARSVMVLSQTTVLQLLFA